MPVAECDAFELEGLHLRERFGQEAHLEQAHRALVAQGAGLALAADRSIESPRFAGERIGLRGAELLAQREHAHQTEALRLDVDRVGDLGDRHRLFEQRLQAVAVTQAFR